MSTSGKLLLWLVVAVVVLALLSFSPRHLVEPTINDHDHLLAQRVHDDLNSPHFARPRQPRSKPRQLGQFVEPSCAVVPDEQQRAEVLWMCHVLSGLRRLFAGNVASPQSLFIGVEEQMYHLVSRKVRKHTASKMASVVRSFD
jgi:hypothetical protein